MPEGTKWEIEIGVSCSEKTYMANTQTEYKIWGPVFTVVKDNIVSVDNASLSLTYPIKDLKIQILLSNKFCCRLPVEKTNSITAFVLFTK